MNESEFEQVAEIAKLFQFQRILLILVGIAVLILVGRVIRNLSLSATRRVPSKRLFISQIATSLNFIVYIFGGTFIFYAILRPPQELMIAAAGSIAVALGLSLKDLVSSVVAGFILLFDRPFQVGDRVSFKENYGEITSIGLRAVRMTTLDDNLITIPNNQFMTESVSSGNFGALDMMIVVDFHIDIDADIPKAKSLLFETVATSRFVYLKKPINIVVSEKQLAGQLAVVLKVKAYVLDVRFEKAFETDIFTRGIAVLRKHKIARPKLDFVPVEQA